MGLDKMHYPLSNNKLIFKTEFFFIQKSRIFAVTIESNGKKVF